jgi:hypothetical protein
MNLHKLISGPYINTQQRICHFYYLLVKFAWPFLYAYFILLRLQDGILINYVSNFEFYLDFISYCECFVPQSVKMESLSKMNIVIIHLLDVLKTCTLSFITNLVKCVFKTLYFILQTIIYTNEEENKKLETI